MMRSEVQTKLFREKRDFIARQNCLTDRDNRKFWKVIQSNFLKEPVNSIDRIIDPNNDNEVIFFSAELVAPLRRNSLKPKLTRYKFLMSVTLGLWIESLIGE